ncbi:Mutator mutT protein (7,8-dihydro-8-oxoguanine-triphosphatase) [Alkalibacterium sp. AK22]|uniref:(deoxy)nucleoside triphosphate pyrophosphohydrolase n=1 Tax=Alkalibacterium sp. AK22 TaxID=1229520 RepID=UPI000449F0E5|nr:(deoxy)nucleoside triphosphate pyrophosphohydrolase [Alkalibacterium sp. AK22]EXJ23138.1 Mutator mutT protein (7,8-dihydro-8-oxoguanine-triphosphatase) [Alkalibacterium sp. AK22]
MKDIHVVGAIIIENGKILCAQRGSEKSLPDLWEFPGGKIEEGESSQEALLREIKEELLIEVEAESEYFDLTSYRYDFGTVHLTTYLCILKKGRPRLTEHKQVKWLKPDELHTLTWAPADVPAVDKLRNKGDDLGWKTSWLSR